MPDQDQEWKVAPMPPLGTLRCATCNERCNSLEAMHAHIWREHALNEMCSLDAANDRLAVALSSCVDMLYKLKYAGGITLSQMGIDALDEANACLRMWSNLKESKPKPAENGATK